MIYKHRGETRVVIGDSKDEIHGKREGEFDGSGIVMKCWEDWIVERKSPSDARSISQGMKQSTTYAPLLGRLNAAMPVFSTSDNRIPVYSSNTSIPSANRLLPPNQGQPMNTRSIVYQGQPMQYRDPLPLQNARFNPNSHMNQQMRQTSAQNKAVDDLRPNYQGNSQGLNAHHRNINVTRNVGQNPNYQ